MQNCHQLFTFDGFGTLLMSAWPSDAARCTAVGNLTLLCRWTSEISPFPKSSSSSTTFKCPLNTPKYNGNIFLREGSPLNMYIVTFPSLDFFEWGETSFVGRRGVVSTHRDDGSEHDDHQRKTNAVPTHIFVSWSCYWRNSWSDSPRQRRRVALPFDFFGFSSAQRNGGKDPADQLMREMLHHQPARSTQFMKFCEKTKVRQ